MTVAAIIGAGWMGSTHAAAVTEEGDRVGFVVDRQLERAEILAREYDAVAVADIDDLDPDSVDAAIVTTPTSDHPGSARRLLDRGVAVLVEKPHRSPNQEAWSGKDDDPLCWVGMTTRYHGGIQAIREAVVDGTLGEVRWWSDRIWFHLQPSALAPWYFDRALSGGGVLTTNGVHALDRARWILGPVQVRSAVVRTLFDSHDVEDAAVVMGEAGTAAVEISLMWANGPVAPSGTVVVGSRGTAVAQTGQGWTIETADGTTEGTEGDGGEPFRRQWRAFRSALEGNADPGDPTPANLEPVMETIEQIYSDGGEIR